MSKLWRRGTVAVAVVATVWMVERANSQSPQRLPNGGEQEQIVNLQLRVSHLEQALAQMQKSNRRVVEPFEVVDASGNTLVKMEKAQHGGSNLVLYDADGNPTAMLTNESGIGAVVSLTDPTFKAGFIAGVSPKGDGYASAYGMNGEAATIGADANGYVGVRTYAKLDSPPSGGIVLQRDGSANVYAGKPGSARTMMTLTTDGEGTFEVLNADSKRTAYIANTALGGEMGWANAAGTALGDLRVDPTTKGAVGTFGDSNGSQMAAVGAMWDGKGDACIVRGSGKPDKCLSKTVLPLSIGE
jgi:hypothetical protein